MSSDGTPEHQAIERLQRRYADGVTRRAWDDVADLFDPACPITLDLRTGTSLELVGGPAIAEFIAGAIERFDFFVFAVLNSVVDHLEISVGRARGRMYICELRHDATTGEFSQAFGLYQDEYHRTRDDWRFASRRYASLGRHDGATFTAFSIPPLAEPRTHT